MTHSEDSNDTRQLALRFLRVFEHMGKFAHQHSHNELVGRLHLNQLHMLAMLHHEPGIAQKDLAQRIQVTPAAISNSIRELERFGLVKRHQDTADARVLRLHLSEQGQQLVHEGLELRCRGMANLLSALPLLEQQMIVESLERALAARQAEDPTRDRI